MLIQRVLTAVVLLAVLLGALAWSLVAFTAVVTVFIAAALAEWLQLAGWRRAPAALVAAAVGVMLFAIELTAPALLDRAMLPLAVLATLVWLAIAVVLLRGRNGPMPRIAPGLAVALGLLLIAAAWAALMHFLDQGAVKLLSVLVIVWLADTAAYFSGRAFGRRKLAPAISPGKTWAGVYGAMLSVLLVALVCWQFAQQAPLLSNQLLNTLGWVPAGVLLTTLVALSIVGDLFESLLKRQAGVKDSSQLLPGHGGVYDRIDALVPLLPAAALFEQLAR